MRTRVPLFILCCGAIALACAVALAPPAARAGDEDGAAGLDGESAPPDSAAGDSTRVGAPPDTALSAARRTGRRFAPNYSSKYDINRNTDNWTQTLNFATWSGPMDLTNVTTVSIGKDKTLDRDRRNNTNNFTLNYQFPRGVKATGTLGIIRNSTVDAGRTDTQQNSENVNASVSYARPFPGGLAATFRAGAGTTHDVWVDPLTSNRESLGPHAEASANFTAKRLADWSLNTSVRTSRLKSTESTTNTTTNDHNLSGNIALNATFSVRGFDPWRVTVGNNLQRTQYPFRQIILPTDSTAADTMFVQETNDNIGRDVTIATGMTPRPRLKLGGSVSYRNNDINREFDTERSQQSIDRALKGTLAYAFRDSTRVDFRGETSRARSLYDAASRTFLNGTTFNSALGGAVRRPLGRRAAFDAAGNYALQSFQFDDTARNTDDRDIVRGDLATKVDYNPTTKIVTFLRFTFQHNQTVFIDAEKSGTNQTQQVWSILPSFEYRLNPRVSFREEASAIANATYFDFNEDNNRLSRTTELRSNIDARLMPRLMVNLRHSLRFLQDGSYRRGDDGVRRFGKSRDDRSRDITFRADYTLIQGINVNFRQNKRLSDITTYRRQGQQLLETVITTEFTEIEMGCQVNRTLRMGATVGANVRRYQSWNDSGTHNNYWVGSVNFGYVF
jgi:hypothetical protein